MASITRKMVLAALNGAEVGDAEMKALMDLIHGAVDELRDENDALNNKLTEAQKAADTEKAAREKAEGDFTAYKANEAKEANRAKVKDAYAKLLTDSGVAEKFVRLILPGTNMDEMTIGEDGTLAGADKLAESIRTQYADYIETTETRGGGHDNPPDHGGSEPDLGKMSMAEYIAARQKM